MHVLCGKAAAEILELLYSKAALINNTLLHFLHVRAKELLALSIWKYRQQKLRCIKESLRCSAPGTRI